jgi:hypothetical protein
MNSKDNFAVFRRFGLAHCRVLVHLQTEIQTLQQKLADLDTSDAKPGSPTAWRLRTAQCEDTWDPSQKNLLKQLREKLLEYGKQSDERS